MTTVATPSATKPTSGVPYSPSVTSCTISCGRSANRPCPRLGEADQEHRRGLQRQQAEAQRQAALRPAQRRPQEAHGAGVRRVGLDGQLPAVVGDDRGEERHRRQRGVVEETAHRPRQAGQQHVDPDVRPGGQRERQRPHAADRQRIAPELVGGAGRHAGELSADDVGRDVERGEEEHGARDVRHRDRRAVQERQDLAQQPGHGPLRAP
jgi:hypothetical protein